MKMWIELSNMSFSLEESLSMRLLTCREFHLFQSSEHFERQSERVGLPLNLCPVCVHSTLCVNLWLKTALLTALRPGGHLAYNALCIVSFPANPAYPFVLSAATLATYSLCSLRLSKSFINLHLGLETKLRFGLGDRYTRSLLVLCGVEIHLYFCL
jgi:hypothetical protein